LRYHCEYQTGIYPTIPSFLERFSHFYKNSYDQLDALGLFGNPQEQEILKTIQAGQYAAPWVDELLKKKGVI
jgi:hypothetical protein